MEGWWRIRYRQFAKPSSVLRTPFLAYAYFEANGISMIANLLKGRNLLSIPPSGQTASGQAIIAAAYFMPRDGRRRFLVHITDGESNFGCHVQHGIDFCTEKNIHLVTLACGYRDRAAMEKQYGKSIQFLNSFGQLPASLESLLRRTFVYGNSSKHGHPEPHLDHEPTRMPGRGYPMKMFTEEWAHSLAETLKGDTTFQQKAQSFDSNLHFHVLKDPKAGLTENVSFGMWVPTVDNYWYGAKTMDEVDIFLEAKASVFKSVFEGKKNVVLALTMGAIKLKKGMVTKLTGNLGAVNRFVEVAGSV